MTNSIRYVTSTDRGPSNSLWKGNGPLDGPYFVNPNRGWGHWNDFHWIPASGSGITIVEADDNASVACITTEECGVVRIAIASDDNEQGLIGFGDATTAPLVMSSSTGECMFEARVRSSSVTNDVLGMFVGLAEEGSCAADFIADDGADIADKDVVGFIVLNDDGDALDAIYQTSGSAFGTALASCGSLTAATWVKLGLYFDGDDTCYWYVNGTVVKSLSVSTTGFPDGEELNPILAVKVSSNAALNVDMDWWAFAQEAV